MIQGEAASAAPCFIFKAIQNLFSNRPTSFKTRSKVVQNGSKAASSAETTEDDLHISSPIPAQPVSFQYKKDCKKRSLSLEFIFYKPCHLIGADDLEHKVDDFIHIIAKRIHNSLRTPIVFAVLGV